MKIAIHRLLYMSFSCLFSLSFSLLPFQLHSDRDRGDGSIKYVLIGDGAGVVFEINETSGDIHAKKRLDREEKAYYILRAQAVNRRTGQALEDWSNFTIKIHDINDNEPKFERDTFLATVPEMSEVGE